MNATGPKIATSDNADAGETPFLAEALDRYDAAWSREEENITQGYEDLEFLSGEGQWDPDVKAERETGGRPCLTINRLPQFVRQITGDIRQMRPAIKCVPVDSKGDPKVAEKRAGIIRYVENRSDAAAVYYRGADQQVQAGRGAWEVVTEYAGDSTFEQEIRISPIEDAISVLWDPDAILPQKVDADFCFVPVDVSRGAFKRRWPDAIADSMGDITHRHFDGWYGEDYIRVAVYWHKVPITRTLLLADNFVEDLTNADDAERAEAEELVRMAASAGIPVRIEKREGKKVRRAVITGGQVLEEPVDWPGRFIPIVDLAGEEIRIGRKVIRHGAVRFARDPQRMYNYYASAEAEATALQPKAPFVGTRKNFEKHRAEWETANSENLPFLTYDPDPLNGGQAPQRQSPPVSSSGITQGRIAAAEDLQATTGIYNASLGAEGNEDSGKAIIARQREGDTGTYVYVENFGRAVAHTGRIINDLIPHIYDTTRTVRIIGEDGQEELVEVNQPALIDGDDSAGPDYGPVLEGELEGSGLGGLVNDMTIGEYDIVMQMGPSFNTKREESREGMAALMQSSPELAAGILDLVVDAQDWPNKQAVKERVEMLLPPHVQAAIAAKRGEPAANADPMAEQKAAIEAKVAETNAEALVVDAEAKLIAAQAAKLEAQAKLAALLNPPAPAPAGPVGPSPEGDRGPPGAPGGSEGGPEGGAPPLPIDPADAEAAIAELAAVGIPLEALFAS
jgi:Phage P22-like portal protein